MPALIISWPASLTRAGCSSGTPQWFSRRCVSPCCIQPSRALLTNMAPSSLHCVGSPSCRTGLSCCLARCGSIATFAQEGAAPYRCVDVVGLESQTSRSMLFSRPATSASTRATCVEQPALGFHSLLQVSSRASLLSAGGRRGFGRRRLSLRRPWRFLLPRLVQCASSIRSHEFNPGAGLRPLGYVQLGQLNPDGHAARPLAARDCTCPPLVDFNVFYRIVVCV